MSLCRRGCLCQSNFVPGRSGNQQLIGCLWIDSLGRRESCLFSGDWFLSGTSSFSLSSDPAACSFQAPIPAPRSRGTPAPVRWTTRRIKASTPAPQSQGTAPASASSCWTILPLLACSLAGVTRLRWGGLSLRSLLRVPPLLSDPCAVSRLCLRLRGPEELLRRHHCVGLSLRPPSLHARCGALSLRVRPRSLSRESSCRNNRCSALRVRTHYLGYVSIVHSFVDGL